MAFERLTTPMQNDTPASGRGTAEQRLAPSFLAFTLLLIFSLPATATPRLFGYHESRQSDMSILTQWLSVMKRHIREDTPDGDCSSGRFNKCHLRQWYAFLKSIKGRPRLEQMRLVNNFANKQNYVLDIDNYGVEDYWAIVKEFLNNGGDCEDYAITKLYSLQWLGFPISSTRLVILQDTNLGVQHAVLAVYINGDIKILDNQTQQIVSHRKIAHYVPIYSVNQRSWWMYTP